MIHIFLNALAASAGGGLTYVRNVAPVLAAREDVRATFLVPPAFAREFSPTPHLHLMPQDCTGAVQRSWFEQTRLPAILRRSGAQVLISAGNFALLHSPVPQVLLSRNALYTSSAFFRDLRSRGDYRLWLDTVLKRRLAFSSVRAADCTIAPSASFAHDLSEATGRFVEVIPHGFDRETFFAGDCPLPAHVASALHAADDCYRLLFVSHYNYYRNFETLLRALPAIQRRLAPRRVRLFLTCTLRTEDNPGAYRAESAAHLLREPGIAECVVQLGAVPYAALHHLYAGCDLYVSPAYR
jgi:glycosyltransferase involved in cell wall biosynthesis